MLRCHRRLPWKNLLAYLYLLVTDPRDGMNTWSDHTWTTVRSLRKTWAKYLASARFLLLLCLLCMCCFLFGSRVLKFYLLIIVCLKCCFLFYMGVLGSYFSQLCVSIFCSGQNSWWLLTPDDRMHLPKWQRTVSLSDTGKQCICKMFTLLTGWTSI